MTNPMESFESFTRHCAFYGISNPFSRLQWHVTVKHLTESEAYMIVCDLNAGYSYIESVNANTAD
jgi:hypothetical protein